MSMKPMLKVIGMDNSEIDVATIAAYRAAHYTVLSPEPFVMQVGEFSERLARLMASNGKTCAAFITAWNPYSEIASLEANSTAQVALTSDLKGHGLIAIPGFGSDPEKLWPGEESLLVLGLELQEAREIGIKYGQNAIVWVGQDVRPKLVLLR